MGYCYFNHSCLYFSSRIGCTVVSYYSDQFKKSVRQIDQQMSCRKPEPPRDAKYRIVRHASDGSKRSIAFNITLEEATHMIQNPTLLRKEWSGPGQLVIYTYTIEREDLR